MRWLPHRHRTLAFLLALPLVAPLLVVAFFGTTMLAAQFGAGHFGNTQLRMARILDQAGRLRA